MEFRVSKEDGRKHGIYCIRTLINNKVYYGSAKNLKKRFTSHLNSLRNNDHGNSILQRHFNKYGEESFSFEVVEFVDDLNLLIKREQFYLDALFSSKEESPFNICRVAGSTLGLKGQISWSKGKKMSEAFLQRQREVKTRSVAQYSLNGELLNVYPKYSDRKRLLEKTNVKKEGLINCCAGILHSYKGFIWRFYDKSPNQFIPKDEMQKLNPKPIKSISIFTIEGERLRLFKSAKEAERVMKVCRTQIKNLCNSDNNFHKGVFWTWE